MAITNAIMQMRRGYESDFDADKMRPGEWAVSLDTKYVRMCFSPGVCVRMATYDAFETDMARIEAILEEAKTIEEVVTRINEEVSANAQAVSEYTEQALQSASSAKTSETNAKNSEINAKASETNAKVSEENAQRVFESLPEDYKELSNAFYNTAIKQTVFGESIHATDSTDNKAVEFALHGKATQNGTPAPEAPIDIEVSGEDGSVEVKSIGKNILNPEWFNQKHTTNGMSATNNGDNTWTFSGERTDASVSTGIMGLSFTADNTPYLLKKAGAYTLSLIGDYGSNSQYFYVNLYYNGASHNNWLTSLSKLTNYITEEMLSYEDFRVSMGFYLLSTQTFKTGTVGVQIEYGETATPFEKFKESTTNISTPNGLAGTNGVCDSKELYADNTGKKIQRIGVTVFDGSESWFLDAETNFNEHTFTAYCSELPPIAFYGRWIPIPSLCNRLAKSETPVWDNKITSECFMVCKNSEESANKAGQITIRLNKGRVSEISISALKAFLSANPLEVWYELAEPIITDLTAEEVSELEAVRTFYPTTNILNDAGCGMEVTYLADTRNYIDKIIGDRLSALEYALINNI